MEIRVYSSLDTMNVNKPIYCARVADRATFCFDCAENMFRSIYGQDVIIVFVCT